MKTSTVKGFFVGGGLMVAVCVGAYVVTQPETSVSFGQEQVPTTD